MLAKPEMQGAEQHNATTLALLGQANILYREKNSHTAMLDFGMTKESDSGLVALAPNGSTGKVEGVVVLEYRVGLLGKSLKVGLKNIRKGAHRYIHVIKREERCS